MKTGVIQLHSYPGQVKQNVKKGKQMFLTAVKEKADIIVFPELWTCGYYLETEDFRAAAEQSTEIVCQFKTLCREHQVLSILPVPQRKGKDLYIGLYVIEKDGSILAEYQKSFLWGREQNYFMHGTRVYEPIQTSLGTIGVLICYDIEFPEPSRLLALKGAQVIFVPSVWSIGAQKRWTIQLPARALDNTVFVVGINNVGEGACGQSKIISPMGEVIAEASEREEEILYAEIDVDVIGEVREKIPYLKEYDTALLPGGHHL